MLCHASLHCEGDIECSTRCHGTTDTRHGDRCDVVHGDVGCWLGNEHEGLVKAIQMALVGLDRALDTRLLVVTDEIA